MSLKKNNPKPLYIKDSARMIFVETELQKSVILAIYFFK